MTCKACLQKNKDCDGMSVEVNAAGDKFWLLHKKLHRDNDLPAIERADGTKEWFNKGFRHRLNRPAIEKADGDKYWFVNGKLYRKNNLPTFESPWRVLKDASGQLIREWHYEITS